MNEKEFRALIARECKYCRVNMKKEGKVAACAAREFFPLTLIVDGEPDDNRLKEIQEISEQLWEKFSWFLDIDKMPPCMVYNRFEYPATDECVFTYSHIKNLLRQLTKE